MFEYKDFEFRNNFLFNLWDFNICKIYTKMLIMLTQILTLTQIVSKPVYCLMVIQYLINIILLIT